MRIFQNHLGLFLVIALFASSCALEDRTPLTVQDQESISFRDGKVQDVFLSPQGPKGFSAEVSLKIEGGIVQVVGRAKGMIPGAIYFATFTDASECGGQPNKEPLIISKIEADAAGFGFIDEVVKVSIEDITNISIGESTAQNPLPGELRSCGEL